MNKQRESKALSASTDKTKFNEGKPNSKTKDKRNDGGYIWII